MIRPLALRQLVIDLVVAGALFIVLALISYHFSGSATIPVILIFSGGVALRRLSPGLALGLVWAGALLQMTNFQNVQPANVAVLVVLYATSAYGGPVVKALGLASAGVGAVVAALYLDLYSGYISISGVVYATPVAFLIRTAGVLVASLAVLGLSWTLGLLVRSVNTTKASQDNEARAEADRLHAEREVAVEQERSRIARDMHDVVAHSLAVVIAQADGARYVRATDPDAVDSSLQTISSTARDALGDVRVLLTQLRHSQPEGSQPDLTDLGRLFEQLRSTGLQVSLETTGEPQPLSIGEQLGVYRIAQESLTNALRHGDARHPVLVRFRWETHALTMGIHSRLRPDAPGSGTGPGPVAQAGGHLGHGVPGMTERAQLMGGSLSVGRVTADWFAVVFVLPLGLTEAPFRPQRSIV